MKQNKEKQMKSNNKLSFSFNLWFDHLFITYKTLNKLLNQLRVSYGGSWVVRILLDYNM